MAVIDLVDLQAINPDIDETAAAAMIADAIAQAQLAAPCLANEANLTETQLAQYKAVLRSAIIRWDDAGSGGVTTYSTTAGSFSEQQTTDSSRLRKGLFWPSEVDQLRRICGQSRRSGTVDTGPDGQDDRWPRGMSIAECERLGGLLPQNPLEGALL